MTIHSFYSYLRLFIFALLFLNVGSAADTFNWSYSHQGSNNPHAMRINSLSLTQVLQQSINAMYQLRSASFDITWLNWQTRGNEEAVSIPRKEVPQSTTTNVASTDYKVYLRGSGYEILPRHVSSIQNHIIMGTMPMENFQFGVVASGNSLYTQNQQGQWYVLDKSIASSPQYRSYFGGVEPSQYTQLLMLALNVPLIDNSQEAGDAGGALGTGFREDTGYTKFVGFAGSLRHITAFFSKNMLPDLLYTMGMIQDKQLELSTITNQKAQLDLWIDEKTAYVQQLAIDINISTITPSSSTAAISVAREQYMRLDYSNFNEPGKIALPANALPTKNVPSVFTNYSDTRFQTDRAVRSEHLSHVRKVGGK